MSHTNVREMSRSQIRAWITTVSNRIIQNVEFLTEERTFNHTRANEILEIWQEINKTDDTDQQKQATRDYYEKLIDICNEFINVRENEGTDMTIYSTESVDANATVGSNLESNPNDLTDNTHQNTGNPTNNSPNENNDATSPSTENLTNNANPMDEIPNELTNYHHMRISDIANQFNEQLTNLEQIQLREFLEELQFLRQEMIKPQEIATNDINNHRNAIATVTYLLQSCRERIQPMNSTSIDSQYLNQVTHSSSLNNQSSNSSNQTLVTVRSESGNCTRPEYSGKVYDWRRFKQQFNLWLKKKEVINEVDQFHNLEQALHKTEHAALLNRISYSGNCFAEAMALLDRRLNDSEEAKSMLDAELKVIGSPKESIDIQAMKQLILELENRMSLYQIWEASSEYLKRIVLPIILSKIPNDIMKPFLRQKPTTIQDCVDYLQSCIDGYRMNSTLFATWMERSNQVKINSNQSYRPHANQQNKRPFALVSAVNISQKRLKVKQNICILCSQIHVPSKCMKFASRQTRIDRLQELKVCETCFKEQHHNKPCLNPPRCFKCAGRHFFALCPIEFANPKSVKETDSNADASI